MSPYVRPTSQPISRRTAMIGAGVAALAVSGLSACGSEPAPAAPASSPPPAGSGSGLSAKLADIPVGGGKIFADAKTVITQPTAGEFKAFSSICTHKQCPVTEVTTTINCKCHGSKYNLTNGAPTNGPATEPLAAKEVKVEGDAVTVT
jgi:Rieske Fe-S protein